jgi:hypothetical protein
LLEGNFFKLCHSPLFGHTFASPANAEQLESTVMDCISLRELILPLGEIFSLAMVADERLKHVDVGK